MSCGNNPDGQGTAEEEQVAMPRRKQVRRVDRNTCQRCKMSRSMYVIRSVTYCRPCFETALYGRFIKLLHPPLKSTHPSSSSRNAVSHAVRPPSQSGDVLIALSSGAGSTVMLDQLLSRSYVGRGDGASTDKTRGEKEPVWGKGWVVYVEFAGALEGVEDRLDEIKGWVEGLNKGLGWVGIRAEDVFDGDLKDRLRRLAGVVTEDGKQEDIRRGIAVDLKDPELPLFPLPSSSASSAKPLDHLRSLLASLPPPSRPALLSNILSSLLTFVSQTIPNISHLLLGETSTRQAQRLISGTASGRGWSLPLDLASARKDDGGLVRLKPMKDISVKEAAVYCRLKGLDGFTRNDRRWDAAGPAGKRDARGKGGVTSLEMLTEQFIAGLSVSHPSTVSTINRTGDKLVFPGQANDSPTCPVCQLPVDPSALEWKSRSALTSLLTKTNPPSLSDPKDSSTPLAPLLCYACLTTFTPSTVASRTNKNEPVPLPFWIAENVARRHGRPVERSQMKNTINAFLIQDE
ncbi:hypothetical protein IAR55_000814 [Kwoniella newhampshirensis]|uniref:Cytoplasmic tRNA 2-thiolation protein 2 n=1 Tax=Kwoniella newhampshirensis TaxID=1651941 RepID=A0AAW0Z407_9TREE